ncbi:ferredoxin [Vagococcus xieshaowenii]|uniref:Ferredoxin n=1 Tax=Vagococcus xieshaowenii TaxID=2562451 RepID=A0AAJ5JQC0_9ENTE|nr:ferredoxin [Vagococcus xieshaowenii]QCA28714.1 ferredoxin [Vagococcus xieshaowenii]TFZ40478.1 ferredoxin [Vagococcus xieshaowenii]
MLTKIIPEKCIACGLCQLKAPDIFDYTADGIVIFQEDDQLLEKTIPSELEAQCLAAYKKCPTRAIIIEKLQK